MKAELFTNVVRGPLDWENVDAPRVAVFPQKSLYRTNGSKDGILTVSLNNEETRLAAPVSAFQVNVLFPSVILIESALVWDA